MLKSLPKQSAGITMIELLVSIALSFVVLSAAVSVTVTLTKQQVKMIQSRQAETQAIEVGKMLMRDIRRAGYWSNSDSILYLGINSNPFINIDTQSNNCISLSYDEDNDGVLDSGSGSGVTLYSEALGYRYQSNQIQTATSTSTNANVCQDDDWLALLKSPYFSATNLVITDNTVTTSIPNVTNRFIDSRAYTITIQGTKNLTISVKNRNDRVR